MSRFTFTVKTMGCKANVYDSLVIERELREIGGVNEDDRPDVFVLNSCTVTAEADRQAHREVTRASRHSPGTWTVVTGCFAQVSPQELAANPAVGLVLPNDSKSRLKAIVAGRFGIPVQAPDGDPDIYWGQLPPPAGKTRAVLKIQEGCNDRCTYCIIPAARGRSRSVRMGVVLAEVRRLTDAGVREVVITGTNIADYGAEFGHGLEDLVEAILAKTSMGRVRLSSLDPTEVSERLLAAMSGESRLMPHFHVSLQSPVSRVLRAMKRDYRREEVERCLELIHASRCDAFVGMDVIAGFPSETAQEHEEAVSTLSRLPWTRLHVFPYSERDGTPATRIPGAAKPEERRRRAGELRELSNIRHGEFASRFVGQAVDGILWENPHEVGGLTFVSGHAPNYVRVVARARTPEAARKMFNTVGSARIHAASPRPAQDWTLEGSLE